EVVRHTEHVELGRDAESQGIGLRTRKDVHVRIEESRQERLARAIDNWQIFGNPHPRTDGRNASVDHDHVRVRVRLLAIEDPNTLHGKTVWCRSRQRHAGQGPRNDADKWVHADRDARLPPLVAAPYSNRASSPASDASLARHSRTEAVLSASATTLNIATFFIRTIASVSS